MCESGTKKFATLGARRRRCLEAITTAAMSIQQMDASFALRRRGAGHHHLSPERAATFR